MTGPVGGPVGLSTTGVGTAEAVPDVVRIGFGVTSTAAEPGAAFEAARARLAAVREVLAGHGLPGGAVLDTQLRLTTVWSYPDGRQVADGHQCDAGFVVETRPDDAAHLMVDLVAAGVTGITSVDFDVADRRGLLDAAHRTAVADARRRAELLAEAAGVRLGAVLQVVDGDRGPGGPVPMAAFKADVTDAALTPGRITVTASVTVGYALEA